MMIQHPLSAAFPPMVVEEYDALKDSISIIGVQEPITVFEGMVLDGWHRFIAANEVGARCPTVELGDVNPQDFVIAKNKARRHITAGQLAAAVVAVYGWRTSGRNVAPGATLAKSNQQLADMAGVSARTIRQAKVVEAKAAPEVKAAVKAGAMSVKKAAETLTPHKIKNAGAAQLSESRPAVPPHDAGPPDDDVDLVQELEALNAEVTALRKLAAVDDKTAEALRWRDAYDTLERRCNEHLRTIAARDSQISFLSRQLKRCGRAVGEDDTDKIAPTVERLAREAQEAR